jgi:hypothetical protein
MHGNPQRHHNACLPNTRTHNIPAHIAPLTRSAVAHAAHHHARTATRRVTPSRLLPTRTHAGAHARTHTLATEALNCERRRDALRVWRCATLQRRYATDGIQDGTGKGQETTCDWERASCIVQCDDVQDGNRRRTRDRGRAVCTMQQPTCRMGTGDGRETTCDRGRGS